MSLSGPAECRAPKPFRTESQNGLNEAMTRLEKVNFPALRRTVLDLTRTFGGEYPKGREYLKRLDGYEKRLPRIREALSQGNAAGIREVDEIIAFQRKALLANPLVSSRPILFVVRQQYKKDHHNSATMFQTDEVNTKSFSGGGAMKTIDLRNHGKVKTIIEVPNGIARDPEVHFTGKKIIFSMRKDVNDDYHIYEINADGAGLKQLTFGEGLTDIDPLYMPDDTIIFSSTREPKYCMCAQHIMANLFRMDPDGANIHQIGKSTLHEAHPSLMPDGRIIYDRWEYVDRNFGDAQGLWTVYPDGTNHAVYYGNNTLAPGGAIDPHIIPGTEQVVCIFSSCHDRPWGALTVLDRRLGIDGSAAVVHIWPADAIDLVGGIGGTKPIPLDYKGKYAFDNLRPIRPKYEDPFPLNDKYFLCSRMTGDGEQMGIYLVDVFGNEILLHTEEPGCYDPMPLSPRPRPPLVPSRRDFENKQGHLYVVDVYQGTHMKGVKHGQVKYLRVVESPEKRFWTYTKWDGQGAHCPGMNWHSFENKRILGTVPVEEDGSAYFEVASDRFIYFQLLDANGMMIQSMRSGTIVQSGEVTGCLGCHENRRIAPPPKKAELPMAIQRPPSKLNGWYGPPRQFSYMAEVQPVFDKHCAGCHDYEKDAGKKLNLARDRTPFFNASYTDLWLKKYIKAIGAGPAQIQQPYSWGSHASTVVEVIRNGHMDIKLDKESFDRLVTWIDINGPYYPYYASAYPENLAGRSPLNDEQIQRLSELTGVNLSDLGRHTRELGPQVSFDRPQLSPCLEKLTNHNDPKYFEALAIIRAGKEMLEEHPRADMPGFQACPLDEHRRQKYAMRRQAELCSRKAIRKGTKVYDSRTKTNERNTNCN